jgi:glutaredoxin
MKRKQKCIQCDELKNLLHEKGVQYDYLDMTEMPNKTMIYLRTYCNSFPIVLNINHSFSNFEETLPHFHQKYLNYFYILYLYYYNILLLF